LSTLTTRQPLEGFSL